MRSGVNNPAMNLGGEFIAKKKCPESGEKITFPEDCVDCEYLKPRGRIKCCTSPKKP